MSTVKIDVIIPAYRPGEEFEKLLERLSAQKYPINRIIVMNTEKKFWKKQWEIDYPLVEVHHCSITCRKSCNRNIWRWRKES